MDLFRSSVIDYMLHALMPNCKIGAGKLRPQTQFGVQVAGNGSFPRGKQSADRPLVSLTEPAAKLVSE